MKETQELYKWVLGKLKRARAMEQVRDAAGSQNQYYSGKKSAFEEVASHVVIHYGCEAVKESQEQERKEK